MKRFAFILTSCCVVMCQIMVGQTPPLADSSLQHTVSKIEKKVAALSQEQDSLCREVRDLRRRESFRDDAAEKAQATIDRTVNVQTWIIGIVAFVITCLSAAGYLSTRRRLREIDNDFAKRTRKMDDDFRVKLDDFDSRVNKAMDKISSGESALSEQRKAYTEMLEKGEKAVLQAAKLTESTEREIEELKRKIPDISLVGEPSPEMQQQLDELTKKLRELERLGGQLSAEEHYQKGWDQYYKNLFDLALLSFERAIELKPRYAEAWASKGWVLGRLNRPPEDRLAAYEKAIECKPDYAPAWYNKGIVLHELSRPPEEELAAYEKAIEYRTDFAEAWNGKGVVLGELNRPLEEQLATFEGAIKYKPDHAGAWSNKGVVLGKLNRKPEEQLAACEKAIEYEPNFAEAWSNKGVVLTKLNRLDEALQAHDKAIELKRGDSNVWFNRACAYALLSDKDKALTDLRKAIELDPKYKEEAKTDDDFKSLWEDEDFKKLVGE